MVKTNMVFVILISLLFSSCVPAATFAPAPTATPSSEPTKNVSAPIASEQVIIPIVPSQPIEQIDKLINSNQIVTPFHPTDVFMFALPEWSGPDGLEVAKKLHATIIGSCHQDIDWRLQKWLDNAALLSKVTSIANKAGMKYTAHFTVDRDNKDQSIPFDEKVAVRDIAGNIIAFTMPGEETLRIWKSVHYPEWKDYMTGLAKKAVDAGVNILCIDGWTYNFDVISKGGDFSENSLIGFREYIKNKYNLEQLKSRGISDINTFDYREYKKNTAKDLLMADFENFQLSSSKIFWQAIINETRAYAESQGKTVLFTVNVNINAWNGSWFTYR